MLAYLQHGGHVDGEGYTYHGDDDELASWGETFTSRNGDGAGDAEENFHAAIKLIAACKAGGSFLDVGSGLGRIIEEIRPEARKVVGLEPDPQRFQVCRSGFAADQGVEVLNTTSREFRRSQPGRRFDVITVSMVVQHVSTRICREIMDDVRELLVPNGIGIVSTTHFFEERFTYEADPSPHEVTEFDLYAENSARHDKGIPVRMFSKDALYREVERAGLQVVDWGQFSYVRPEKVDGFGALYGVPADRIRDVGVSQYAVVRRAPTPAGGLVSALRRRFG